MKDKMRKDFTIEEVRAKAGKRVIIAFDGRRVRKGTQGKVLEPYPEDYTCGVIQIRIEWDLPDRQDNPVVDLFTKEEYQEWLVDGRWLVEFMTRRPKAAWILKDVFACFLVLYFFLLFPAGLRSYHLLPNELFDKSIHEPLSIDGVEIGVDFAKAVDVPYRLWPRVDAWRNKETGIIYTKDRFAQHRRREYKRVFFVCLAYGLIGCLFYSGRKVIEGKPFLQYFLTALMANLIIAVFVVFTMWMQAID